MSAAPNAGEVLVAADAESLARLAAHWLRAWALEAVARGGPARIALSGGSTPRAMFRVLAGLPLPWQKTEWFWVDDRAVPADHPRSNYGAARADLFDRVPVPPEQVHPMTPDGPDLDAVARRYEARLAERFGLPGPGGEAPAFDLVLLGIGDDGHTASLFPGEPHVDITDRWVVAVPAAEGREARLTLTAPVIAASRRAVMLVQGEAKREPVRQARAPGSAREVPARVTQQIRGELYWLVDAAARP
ncbi:MAG TPA: 6-phosphogluconolactonase [Polyangiaceae bacterium]|nr:6-phosphogluconolactonase [Polyangiaceae bacterium]